MLNLSIVFVGLSPKIVIYIKFEPTLNTVESPCNVIVDYFMWTNRSARCHGFCFGHARHEDRSKLHNPLYYFGHRYHNSYAMRWTNNAGATVVAHKVIHRCCLFNFQSWSGLSESIGFAFQCYPCVFDIA